MDISINTSITEEQAAALARVFQVKEYRDGNELIARVADAAALKYKRHDLVVAVMMEPSNVVLAETKVAYDVAASKRPATGVVEEPRVP